VNAVSRSLELFKLEGLGFSQAKIVNELSKKFAYTKCAVVETNGTVRWRKIIKQEWRKPS
jgi:hypothetical protein